MIQRLLVTLIIIISIVIQSSSAWSDSEKSTVGAIKELLTVMNISTSMETSLLAMKDTITKNSQYFSNEMKEILTRDLKPEEAEQLIETFDQNNFGATRLYELFRYKISLERIEKEVMIPVYQKYYSESEIHDLVAFYKSDLGQKTLKLTPDIHAQISTKTREISQMALNQAKDELAFELKKTLTDK